MKKSILNILYVALAIIIVGETSTFSQCPNGTYVDIVINPDQYPEETSWAILGFYEDTIVSGGPYVDAINYSPQVTQLCIENGNYSFEIYDVYGDGMAGSLWGGQDGSYYVLHCGDTLVEPDSANFEFEAFHGFTLEDCAPPPPVLGCMDVDYVEFLPIATVDDGSCNTLKVFGCTDNDAFNFDSSANTNINIGDCEHTLVLTDLAGNGWAGAFLQVFQGDNFLGEFTVEYGFEAIFDFNLNAFQPVEIKFNTTQQSQFTSVQCGYKLYSEEQITIEEPGGFVTPLIPFQSVFGIPYCGNECIERTYGCTDIDAVNYTDYANTNDESCYYTPGCTSPTFIEYNPLADYDNGSCAIPIVLGCMDNTALNYNPDANTEINGSCIEVIEGCTNELAFNYSPNANVNDNSCIPVIYGCVDPTMFNYCSECNTNDGGCEPYVFGCTDSVMFNYNPLANADNNSCIPFIYGCTDPSALNYNPQSNSEDFSCIDYIYGCTDSTAVNYDVLANTDNGSCVDVVEGCMDQDAYNYSIEANVNDDSYCLYDANCISGPGNPYWLNDICYQWVIDVDDYCCSVEWDETCQSTYNYCGVTWTGPEPIERTTKNKNLIMSTNLLGEEVNKTSNQLLLYIYDDGSIDKKIIINK